jgi:class 3 adenylate cyclase
MDFTFQLEIIGLLLERDGRVSWRYIARQLGLTPEDVADLRHELLGRGLADEEQDGQFLVSVGQEQVAAAPLASTQPVLHTPKNLPFADGKVSYFSEAERRQLTVMFVDLVGSTNLSTRLDPEDLRDLITAFQDTCRSAISKYDGFIARYMGDGLLVYFGYPRAHEDDAARAVLAGMETIDTLKRASVDSALAGPLSVRIGVATGAVVVGDLIGEGAAEEAAVVGETPNLAARLQAQAGEDQLVISDATRILVGEQFQLSGPEVVELKGMEVPERIWRVVGAAGQGRDHRAGPGSGSKIVGRQEELGLLRRAWDLSIQGSGQTVLLQGEPGLGKSRLAAAVGEWLSPVDCASISLQCSPYHVNSPLHPVVEHLGRFAGWQPEDSAEVRLHKFEDVLSTQSTPLAEVMPLYADLLSLPLPTGRYAPLTLTPAQQRESLLDAICTWFLEVADKTPVLLVCEDLHWADPTTRNAHIDDVSPGVLVELGRALSCGPHIAQSSGVSRGRGMHRQRSRAAKPAAGGHVAYRKQGRWRPVVRRRTDPRDHRFGCAATRQWTVSAHRGPGRPDNPQHLAGFADGTARPGAAPSGDCTDRFGSGA